MKITEAQLLAQTVQYLQYLENQDKLFYSRINVAGIYDKKISNYRKLPLGVKLGFSDLIVIIKGQAIFLEAKSSTGVQSEKQKDFEQLCSINKAPYYVFRSIEEVKKVVELWINK